MIIIIIINQNGARRALNRAWVAAPRESGGRETRAPDYSDLLFDYRLSLNSIIHKPARPQFYPAFRG